MEQEKALAPGAAVDGALADGTLVDILRLRCRRRDDRPLYTFLGDGEHEAGSLTCRRLDRRARSLAVTLRELLAPGDRALLLYPPGLDLIPAFFGCLYGAAVAVPGYPPRARRALPRLQAILDDARPRAVLTTAALEAKLEPLKERIPALGKIAWVVTDEVDEDLAEAWRKPEIDGDTLAFLQYTSGSVSEPKGVMVSHRNLVRNEEAIRRAFDQSEDSVIVGWLPMYHDMGLIGNVLQPLYAGARAVLMSPMAFLSQPGRWLRAISRYRATTSGGPNFAYELCTRKISERELEDLDLSSWRVAFNGAEPVRPRTLDAFSERFAACGFRRQAFYPCYGLAESTLFVSGGAVGSAPRVESFSAPGLERGRAVPEDGSAPETAASRRLVSCGGPAAEQEVRIVDPERRVECPPGRIGEIWIRGPSVAGGYWRREQASARDFGARLAGGEPAGPFLRTGDLGFLSRGELFVTGRLKDLVILRGRNLYPQDLEDTAERAHAALRPGCSAAFGVEADSQERLVLVLELERSFKGEVGEVVQAVRRALVEDHEVQVGEVVLVRVGGVPKTTSGKIRRRACRDLLLAGKLPVLGRSRAAEELPRWTGEALDRDLLAGLESGEQRAVLVPYLRALGGRILRLDPAEIAAERPLSRYGLDSLAAVELQHQVAGATGVSPSLAKLLAGASLEEVANEVLQALARDPGEPEAGEPELSGPEPPGTGDPIPLSFMQKTLWFEQQLAPRSPAYNVFLAARLGAETDVPTLRRALEVLVKRHPILRSKVTEDGGQPALTVVSGVEPGLAEHAVEGDREALLAAAAEAVHRPFDLARDPLLRAAVFRRPAGERILALAVHHLAIDGWSLWLFLEELGRAYGALRSGSSPAWEPPAADYREYVRWQSETLAGPGSDRLRRYWHGELGGSRPVLELPYDRPRSKVATQAGGARPLRLDPDLVRRLRRLARDSGTTLYVAFLAAYQVLLARYSGQGDVVVGTAVSGRSRPEFDGVVGCFFNVVAVRADLSGAAGFRDLLRRVRGKVAAALEHQDLPSSVLAEELSAGRRTGGSAPLFETTFLYQQLRRLEGAVTPLDGEEIGLRLTLGDLTLEPLWIEPRAARQPLELELVEAGDTVLGWLRYSHERFEAATVERLAVNFKALLEELAAHPDRPVRELSALAPEERRQLLAWSRSGRDYSGPARVEELFDQQAASSPHKIAVVSEGATVSFGELAERADRLADLLAELEK